MDDTPNADEHTFVTKEDLDALKEESEVFGIDNDDPMAVADFHLRQYLPQAILSVGKLARSAANERVRLSAAQYIIDRNLGKVSDNRKGEADLLLEFVKSVAHK